MWIKGLGIGLQIKKYYLWFHIENGNRRKGKPHPWKRYWGFVFSAYWGEGAKGIDFQCYYQNDRKGTSITFLR